MKTSNIISTPNITGNIGSCNIQSNTSQIGANLFVGEYKTVQINSCTGEIISNNDYIDYSGIWGWIVLGAFCGVALIGLIFSAYFDAKYHNN